MTDITNETKHTSSFTNEENSDYTPPSKYGNVKYGIRKYGARGGRRTTLTNESKSADPTITNENKNTDDITNESESGAPARFDQAKFDTSKFDEGEAGKGAQWTNETKH